MRWITPLALAAAPAQIKGAVPVVLFLQGSSGLALAAIKAASWADAQRVVLAGTSVGAVAGFLAAHGLR